MKINLLSIHFVVKMVSHMVFGFLCAVVIGVVAVAFTSWSNTPQVLEQNPSSSSRRSSEPRPKPNVRRR